MSRIAMRGTQSLAILAVLGGTVQAQQPDSGERAPVPRQVLTARTALITNGGSESYGAASYFDLTHFDGGPNRAYDSFYRAVKEWGHYDLVGSTDDADIVLVIRFRNPVVASENAGTAGDLPHDWIYDPQLDLSINDPRTGLPLWTITEHIEPAKKRAAANAQFDEAMTRLVDDLHRLILHPDQTLARQRDALPPGALAAARHRQREKHAGTGLLLGAGLATLVAAHNGGGGNCSDPNLRACFDRSRTRTRNAFLGVAAGTFAGAFIGWTWPVR